MQSLRPEVPGARDLRGAPLPPPEPHAEVEYLVLLVRGSLTLLQVVPSVCEVRLSLLFHVEDETSSMQLSIGVSVYLDQSHLTRLFAQILSSTVPHEWFSV